MLAGRPHGGALFRDARSNSIASPRPRKGTPHETPHSLSHHTDRWSLHLLQRGLPERRANASPAARTALLVTNVRAAVGPAFRPLSPCRARLSGLRTQLLAGSAKIRGR